MKLFKNLMIVLSASLLLWGCSDDDESINNGNSTISLSTNILQVDKNGGCYSNCNKLRQLAAVRNM